MINECGDCLMANCCDEFEYAGCEETQKYGEAIRQRVRAEVIDEIILFIEEWRDRQTCIGREVIKLITNELTDSIKSEMLKEKK